MFQEPELSSDRTWVSKMEGGWWRLVHSTRELCLNKVTVWLGRRLTREVLAAPVWGSEFNPQHPVRSWVWKHTLVTSEVAKSRLADF